jgi:hypothetical protein
MVGVRQSEVSMDEGIPRLRRLAEIAQAVVLPGQSIAKLF